MQWFASKVVNIKDAFFIGRGIDYAIGMEGSLKLKEISYVHSEAYAAGELKHGPISLIEDGTVVFSVVTQSALYEKSCSDSRHTAIITWRMSQTLQCISPKSITFLQAVLL